jgi:MFS transporter, putative metabolite:H+ symporter
MNLGEVRHFDVPLRMDAMPVTALHAVAAALCMSGFAFELFELSLGSALAAVFSTPGGAVGTMSLSWLLASVYIGAIVGAPLLGFMADRYGRRLVLSAGLAWLAITSAWAAYTPDLLQLTVARVLSGMALGAYPPLMMSYLTDVLPAGRRGPLILWAFGLPSLALPAGVFLVRALGDTQTLGLAGWQFALLLGAVGSGVLSLLMLRLPESPRWLQARGRLVEAQAVCERFARSRPLLPAVPVQTAVSKAPSDQAGDKAAAGSRPVSPWWRITPLYLLSPVATVAFPLLLGAVLTTRGFKLTDALLFVGLLNFGPLLGSVAASVVVDRFDRRSALLACTLLLALAGGVFVFADSRAWIGSAAVLFGVSAVLYVTALNLYTTELFPTRSRAGSASLAWSFNRLGAALSVLALLPLLKSEGPMTMFGFIAGSLLLSGVLLLTSPRGLARQPVA